MAEFEAAKDAAGVAATHIETAPAEEVERRRQEREAKLRERAMRRAPAPSIPDPPSHALRWIAPRRDIRSARLLTHGPRYAS